MKLNYAKTLKVGTAFAIVMVFWTAYDYVIPLLLENAFGLSNTLRGLVMGLDNLLSLFLLPWFGKLSDKTVSKYGRRTPYIVIGTALTVLLMIFVPVSANSQLKKANELRAVIVDTSVENYSYTDDKGVTYDKTGLYTMLYEKGKENADYCDHTYLKNNGHTTVEDYLKIADDPASTDYARFVKSGINAYASNQVNHVITKAHPGTLAIYMIILLAVLIAMASFRSPAVALMPDVTPKPLRSQANAMINLAGGAGGAIAFLIYTIVLLINPNGFIAIFGFVAASMVGLLAAYLCLVRENKMVAECEAICQEYGVDNGADEEIPGSSVEEHKDLKKKKMISFFLILASIFMWFMGYNAISSNLSIYITKTLNLSSGLGGLISGISMGVSAIAFIPVGWLAGKIGRRKSIIIGFAFAVLSFVLIFFFAANPSSYAMYLYTIFYLLAGFGLIIANVNTFPMVVELSSAETVGKYTGLYYTATMSAQAITPFIAGLIMDKFGNKFLFLYSAISVIIAIVLMVFVKHGDAQHIENKVVVTPEAPAENA